MTKKILVSVVLVFVLAGSAFGAVTSAPMNVTTYIANLLASRSSLSAVSVTQLNFGTTNYGGPYRYANAAVYVSLPLSTLYKISLNSGVHYGAGVRHVAYGTSMVAYWLYKDSGRTVQWGDSDLANTYPSGSSVSAIASGTTQGYTIYGKLNPPTLTNVAGTHTDMVTVTVTY